MVPITITANTATGLRLGARSPRLLRNGTRRSATIRRTGNTSMMTVSTVGGLSASRAKIHKNGQSGRGLAPASVGSGGPLGPHGPTTAATTTTTITTSAEKKASFIMASP